eukprot:4822827-Pyramimonas_sp.AAC.1
MVKGTERRQLVRDLTRVWAFHIKGADDVDYCGDEEIMIAKVRKSSLLKFKAMLVETREITKAVDKTIAQEALLA